MKNLKKYVYDSQRIEFESEARGDRVWVSLNVPTDKLSAGTFVGAGEHVDLRKGIQFQLGQCGDGNNCFRTGNIDTTNWDDGDLEEMIR